MWEREEEVTKVSVCPLTIWPCGHPQSRATKETHSRFMNSLCNQYLRPSSLLIYISITQKRTREENENKKFIKDSNK